MNKNQTIEFFTHVNKLIDSRNSLTDVGRDMHKFAIANDLMEEPPVTATLVAIKVATRPLDEVIKIHKAHINELTDHINELVEGKEPTTAH